MNHTKTIVINIILIVCLLFPAVLFAQSAKEIFESMDQRLPLITELKEKGIVGETLQGYLAFVTDNKPNQDIIEKENIDRKTIYSLISKKEGLALKEVEKIRAGKIAKDANPGEYLQKEDGTWYQK